jgi:hypothetical protein
MRNMRIVYRIIIVFFYVIYCDFAVAAVITNGIDYSVMNNVVVKPILTTPGKQAIK